MGKMASQAASFQGISENMHVVSSHDAIIEGLAASMSDTISELKLMLELISPQGSDIGPPPIPERSPLRPSPYPLPSTTSSSSSSSPPTLMAKEMNVSLESFSSVEDWCEDVLRVQDSIEKEEEGNASLGPLEIDSLLCKAHDDELTEDGSQSQYSVDEVACGEKSKSVITKISATNLTTDIPVNDCHSDAEANSDNTCICTTPKTPKPRIPIAIPPTPCYYPKKKPSSDSENPVTVPIPTTKQKSRTPIDTSPIPASKKKKNPTRKKKKCTACLLPNPNHKASPLTQKTQHHHALTKSSSPRASRLVTISKKKTGESRIPGPLLKGYGSRMREYRFRTVLG